MNKYRGEPFGAYASADHLFAKSVRSEAWDGSRYACILYDLGTGWTQAAPDALKDENTCIKALYDFSGSKDKVGMFRCDNARELKAAAVKMAWALDPSTPWHHETNAIIECRIQHVLAGTRTALADSGLGAKWWPHALTHFCFACNTSALPDGLPPWGRRYKNGHF